MHKVVLLFGLLIIQPQVFASTMQATCSFSQPYVTVRYYGAQKLLTISQRMMESVHTDRYENVSVVQQSNGVLQMGVLTIDMNSPTGDAATYDGVAYHARLNAYAVVQRGTCWVK